MTAPEFDVLGALPEGQVVIEASAGTGKTFTLASLATRYLAERDIAPSELLMVTFTRAATAELRSRIRGQLVASAAALAEGAAADPDDRLSAFLAGADVRTRRARLERAVADFDAAAISTIHSFAAQVRSTLGMTPAIDPDARLTADVAGLVRHACADALATASTGGVPLDELPGLSRLIAATESYVGGPGLVLEPEPGCPGATPEQTRLYALVLASQANLAALLRDTGTIGFDDVLNQLRGVLVDDSSAGVVDALRSRFKVVLIDEFQDTDRVQWEIFSTVFGAGAPNSTLVLVGDPKQAIYRFRGADVSVYLDAVASTPPDRRFTLATNWRSDGASVRATRALLDGVTFGADAIAFSRVDPSPTHADQRMTGPAGVDLSGLSVRQAVDPSVTGPGATTGVPRLARIVVRDLVAHVRELLDTASIPDEQEGGSRGLRPSDIAVLVTSGEHARVTQAALRREGVPAVVAGAGSVLDSWAADQLRLLLAAMERPSDVARVRAHALSWFVPWTARQVADASDEDLAVLQERLAVWSSDLGSRPVAEVLASIWTETGVVARVLGEFDGDRNVTDLDHLAELLHNSSLQGISGVAGLLAVLDDPPEAEADMETDAELVARRIESEAQAVQIMTVWKAKGLQFPVVCLPMLWRYEATVREVVYSDPIDGTRRLDLAKGTNWPDRRTAAARKELAREEITWEQFRVLYVALTRAQHYTAVWWAPGKSSSKNVLSRLLFARDPGDGRLDRSVFVDPSCPVPEGDRVEDALRGLAVASEGTIRVTTVAPRASGGPVWVAGDEAVSEEDLRTAAFSRRLDRSAYRWSFSSITSGSDAGWIDPFDASGSDRGASDETGSGRSDGDGTPADAVPPAAVGRLAGLQAGTEFGTFVHGVLERADFGAPDLGAELRAAALEQEARSGFDLDTLVRDGSDGLPLLVDGLREAIETPLGPLFGSTRLADLRRGRRLDELAFDMRLGGAGSPPTVRDVGRVVVAHLPDGHVLTPWAEGLARGAIDVRLAGYLTGSIDLVARTGGDDDRGGFVVADYKTNRLTARGEEASTADYDAGHLVDAMVEHHYPLQALLYGVALHRYLRSRRRPGAEPYVVLGAAYLFVRGMTGARVAHDGPHPHGVFTWEFGPGLLDALSSLLDGRER